MTPRKLLALLVTSPLVVSACSATDPTMSSAQPLGKGDPIDPAPTVIAPPPPPTVAQIASQFTNYDYDGDGIPELDSLALASFESAADPAGTGKMVVVLVEKRITSESGIPTPVMASLRTFRDDLVADGYRPRFVIASLHADSTVPDGPKLLSLRRFLQRVRAATSTLEGTILVGSFPDATIFHRKLLVDTATKELTLHPERINARADIVLGDLDGNWESLYVRAGTMVSAKLTALALPPMPWAPGTLVSSSAWTYAPFDWHDYFYLRDDAVTISPSTQPILGQWVTFRIDSTALAGPELTPSDRAQPNPIARPEILVSRIDARHVAFDPDMPADIDGKYPVDANNHPQTVTYRNADAPSEFRWKYSQPLEQRVLVDYFARNHQFRWGSDRWLPYRVASIRGLVAPFLTATFVPLMTPIDPTGFGSPTDWQFGSIYDYVDWLKMPAVVRSVIAHSSNLVSVFAKPNSDVVPLIGGMPFEWARGNSASYTAFTNVSTRLPMGVMDWSVMRAIFEHHTMSAAGQSFYMHDGCGINVPTLGDGDVYTSSTYAAKNNAESVLFFLNGLAIYARGKTFYDQPTNAMAYANTSGKRFGYGWKGQFQADASNAAANPQSTADGRVLSAKKAYFWTLLGDFTARVRY